MWKEQNFVFATIDYILLKMLLVVRNENWVNSRELLLKRNIPTPTLKRKKKKLFNRLREFSCFYEQEGYRYEKE